MNLTIKDEYFGPILKYVKDDAVTDINWNGRKLWIDDLNKGRYATDDVLDDDWVKNFSQRIANLVSRSFNASSPLLEAETDDLRISIINGGVSNTGFSISIRKTPAVRRLNEKDMKKTGYANDLIIKLLENFIRARCSVIVVGDVGSGKTELIKYLTKFIPNNERTITVEDNYEIRISKICPNLDSVEIKVNERFGYVQAIKAALRQMCTWLLMAEARSREVAQLLEAASTGCSIITSMHTDDVRKIPDRVKNMLGPEGNERENDIYNFFDVGVLVDVDRSGDKIKRKIAQICLIDHDPITEENTVELLYDNGQFLTSKFPPRIEDKFKRKKLLNPLVGRVDAVDENTDDRRESARKAFTNEEYAKRDEAVEEEKKKAEARQKEAEAKAEAEKAQQAAKAKDDTEAEFNHDAEEAEEELADEDTPINDDGSDASYDMSALSDLFGGGD